MIFAVIALLSSLFLFNPASLQAETKVLAFAGSSRDGSYNFALVNEAAAIAKSLGAKVTVINLRDLPMPFYDADLEKSQGLPPSAQQLRSLMMANDVIFIASPEYNSSVSASLKNALDWASRNEQGRPSRDAFKGKKFLIMSASPGKGGGSRGLEHLKTIIQDVGGTVLPEQITVPDAFQAFDQNGALIDKRALENAVRQSIQ